MKILVYLVYLATKSILMRWNVVLFCYDYWRQGKPGKAECLYKIGINVATITIYFAKHIHYYANEYAAQDTYSLPVKV